MDGSKIIKAEPGDSKVIKRDSYAAMVDALAILESAREQARAIVHDATLQRDATLEEARGLGEEQGLAAYVAGLTQALDAMDGFYARAEPEVVRLALAVARKIIGAELAASPDTVLKIVREALSSGRRARHIAITVHVSDAANVRSNLAKLELAPSCEVDVLAADSVAPGGCVIESEFGIIDARLETQLRIIEQSLTHPGRQQ